MKNVYCNTCHYWQRLQIVDSEGKGIPLSEGQLEHVTGHCMRYPPTILKEVHLSYFPITHEKCQCGEYRTKDD